jgi:hypothetical protein
MNWTSDKIDKIAPALLEAQKVIRGAKKDAENPFLKNKYADLASVFEAVKAHLNAQDIIIIQGMGAVDGKTTMRTILMHTSGQYIAAEGFLPPIDPKGINAAQAMGSAISYMKRYQLQAITGCVGDGEDDDGNAAGHPEVKSVEQGFVDGMNKIAQLTITCEELMGKITDAKAIPHLANLWKKYADDMGRMTEQERKDLSIMKDSKKAALKAAQDAERGEG